MEYLYRTLIKFSNWRSRKVIVKPDELLLLFPHCMQNAQCGQNILNDNANCIRCGKCPFAALMDLRNTYGVRFLIARGGREAIAEAKKPEIKAILSVACEKELAAGILAVFPKKVRAICNTRPQGVCKNTMVDTDQIEQAVREILGLTGSNVTP